MNTGTLGATILASPIRRLLGLGRRLLPGAASLPGDLSCAGPAHPAWSRTEREPEQSSSLLRATLNATADGILVSDTSGRMVIWNRRFVEMWGLDSGVLSSADDRRAIDAVRGLLMEPDAFVERVRLLYHAPEADSFDVLRLRDGRVFERLSQPLRLADGVIGRVWSFRDVTERVRSEKALRDSEERFRATFEQAAVGIAHVDVRGKWVRVNPCLCEIIGYTREELLVVHHAWTDG